MREMLKFYVCDTCGNFVVLFESSGAPMFCCGEEMTHVEPNSTDGKNEKHVPDVEVDGRNVTVKIGCEEHPSLTEHYIKWVLVQTDKSIHKRMLSPGDKPEAKFVLADDEKLLAVYEYCNQHGLWVKEFNN